MEKTINVSKFRENGAAWAIPLIKDDVAYIGACETYFYALDLHSGHKKWGYKTGGIITCSAITHNDVIYFGSFDTYMYALSRDGNLLWKFKTGGIIGASPRIHNGVLYFGSCDNYFYAVSLETHELLWKFKAGDEIICDPLIDGERIYFGSLDGYFYCIDFGGNLVWKFRTGDVIWYSAPAIAGELIYFGSLDQNFYALTKDGHFKWGFRTGDGIFNNPVAFGDTVCFGSRDRYFYVLDQKTGALRWKFRGNDEVDSPALLYNGLIHISSDRVYALDENGKAAWSSPLPPYHFPGGLAAGKNIIVFGSSTGYIHGVNASTGKTIWKFRTKSSALPKFSGLIAPPKWNPSQFDLLAGAEQEKLKAFEPYTFTALDTQTLEREKKKYGASGDAAINPYEAANNPALYAEKLNEDEKKRRKKDDEQIKRQFFGA